MKKKKKEKKAMMQATTTTQGSETVTVHTEGKIIKLNMATSHDLPAANGTKPPKAPPYVNDFARGMVAVHHQTGADFHKYENACVMTGVKRCRVCGGFFVDEIMDESNTCRTCIGEWDIIEQFPSAYADDVSELLAVHAFQRPDGSGNVTSLIDHFLDGMTEHVVTHDSHDNCWVRIGDSKTIFTCHTDTVGNQLTRSQLTLTNGILSNKNGVLGSDDSAGVFVMLRMIAANVPGLYVFHASEESGCRGSRAFVAEHKDDLAKYERCISFDRRGNTSVITYQSPGQCCSTEFAIELCFRLTNGGGLVPMAFKPDDTGTFTDSASYMSIVPECTNISVGYIGAHGAGERLDVAFLLSLADVCCHIVNWEDLPTKRDPSIKVSRYQMNYRTQHWAPAQRVVQPSPQYDRGYFADPEDWMWNGDEFIYPGDLAGGQPLPSGTPAKLNDPKSSDLMIRRFGEEDAIIVDDYFAALSIEELIAMILTAPEAAASIINTMLDLGLPTGKGDDNGKLPHGLQ